MFQSEKVTALFTQATDSGYSSGSYASLNLAQHVGDDVENVKKNRELLKEQFNNPSAFQAASFDKGSKRMMHIFMNQVHGCEVKVVGNADLHSLQGDSIGERDAMITNQKGVILNVMIADCVPVIFYDEVKEIIGVAHAGWRGTAGKIVQKVITEMKREYGSKSENIQIAIGPSIRKESYEVEETVAYEIAGETFSEFLANGSLEKKENGKYAVDLVSINNAQLQKMGVRAESIWISSVNTYTDENYFSARRQGLQSGRFCGSIALTTSLPKGER